MDFILGLTDRIISVWRRSPRGIKFGSVPGVVLLLLIYAFVIEPIRLVVRETTLTLPAWSAESRGLRVAVLSDFHVGPPHITLSQLRRIVEEANATEADLILMPGDFVETPLGWHMATPEEIAAELKHLKAKAGVFATLGNHDWWYNSNRVGKALEDAGIRVLENQAVRIEHNGKTFWVAGLADNWTGKPNVEGTLQQITDNAPVIMFTHNPALFPCVPERVALTIAGHTHGGQIALPYFGRPTISKQPYPIGHIVEGGRHLFVTPGIGTSLVPIRFGVPPEISLLTINEADASGE